MAHTTGRSAYAHLIDRINRFPQGAPPSDLLYKILSMLFNEREAGLAALLPIKPFTADKAAHIWRMKLSETRAVLDSLCSRAVLVDVEVNGTTEYTLPPPMAGFFEFSMMRVRDDIDQKLLSELLYQYITVEDEFIKALFTSGETQLGRTFVHEPALTEELSLHVLDYERASEVIESATVRGVSLCYCRHKKHHVGGACDAPMDICMTFGSTADALIRHGYARAVDMHEGRALLDEAHAHNLVQFGENVREDVNFICNCCGCCCEAMIAARKFAIMHPVHTTNFIPELTEDACSGCGKCVEHCPVEALSLVSANDPAKPRAKRVRLDEDRCLGCGVCVRVCPDGGISLRMRARRVLTPLNSVHKAVVMAIERGKLQHLLFDNRVLWSHRALAAVLGVVLKLPPLKQALAMQQVKSRYLEALIQKVG